MMTYKGNI